MSPGCLLSLALAAMVAGTCCAPRWTRLWLGCTVAATLLTLGAAISVLAGGSWEWHGTFPIGGELPHLRADGLSAFFLVLLSVIGLAGTVYSSEYWSPKKHPGSAYPGRVWWNLLLLFMGLVLLCSNGLHFLIGWELFTLCAYFLITRERHLPAVRRAGWLYLAASHASALCLFAFFAAIAARTGSWDLGPLRDHLELAPLFWLALIGFGLKAGLFPLHIWLPSAHANAPTHVSALLSGVAIKMGIYGLMRFSGWIPTPADAGWVVATLGVASAVLGVAFALGQHDLKRLLAYHSVENIGIILIGLGFAMMASRAGQPGWGRLAMAGALLHVWNHGLFKALLFLGAGSVLHATGTRRMSELGGLWRAMPWTAASFALGAVAISGLPPLNGFVSEWLVYLGLFGAVDGLGPGSAAAVPAAILLAVTGAMALACFVKVVGVVFLGTPRTLRAEKAVECGWFMRSPMLLLGGACILIGLAPALFWPALQSAIAAWEPGWATDVAPAPLLSLGIWNVGFALAAALAATLLLRRVRRNGIARAGTWDCGFAAPTARMQYTAGSFAGIITEWFAWILQPSRHADKITHPFPSRAAFREHTPETVLEKVVEPSAGMVMALSSAMRRLQHGRLQFYILYLVFGLIALALLAFWGGAP